MLSFFLKPYCHTPTFIIEPEYIREFNIREYKILNSEVVYESKDVAQIHYVLRTKIDEFGMSDLSGEFHVVSMWKKFNEKWLLIFNMDSRIIK